jgi:hypothetical protein
MQPCQQCVDLKAEHERLKAKFAELHETLKNKNPAETGFKSITAEPPRNYPAQ